MNKRLLKIIISASLFLITSIVAIENEVLRFSIYLLNYIIIGGDVLKKAIKNIIRGNVFDENFLMGVATIGAFCIGEYPEGVAVMLFYQVGELFQSYAVDKSRKSIASLMDIRPDYANVKKGDDIVVTDPDDVKIGDVIIVKAGERIPLDSVIIEGNSMIDTSALTGESVPREVLVGDEILSGCINVNGLIIAKVLKEFGESTVSKILDLVENASSKKSKSEQFITKFARYYTPIVVIIAVILAIVPPLLFENEIFSDWLYRALSFLVISCPCALVISIPLSFFGGIGGASRKGILVKGGNYLEALSNTEMVVFDKTGTLTKGVFSVVEIKSENISEDELLELAAFAESYSNHPISQSLIKAYKKEIDSSLVSKVEEISGHGVKADVNGKTVLAGNSKLMRKMGIDFQDKEVVGTIVHVAVDNVYEGYILISDELKSDAKEAISKLHNININKTVMLTGDRKDVAQKVGKEINIDDVYYELLPSDKVDKLENLFKQKSPKGKIAFVGDGINDAPVLARADIGIAMGGLGSDAAIEAADVVIMTDEPSKIADAIKISKRTIMIANQNMIFAIGVKILVLILAALGITSMWAAIFADVGVTVLAILNSLRALEMKNI